MSNLGRMLGFMACGALLVTKFAAMMQAQPGQVSTLDIASTCGIGITAGLLAIAIAIENRGSK